MGKGAKLRESGDLIGEMKDHGDQLFSPFHKLCVCFGCPGYICSCVACACACTDKAECCCCLEEGLCNCQAPATCCKCTHQYCCLDMHYACPCDGEVPCACGVCNCHCCGSLPGKAAVGAVTQGPSPANDACFCCRCPGAEYGLYLKCPACIGCSLSGLCCCCSQGWTCHCVTPNTCCKSMRHCCCLDIRCACPCDNQVPLTCGLFGFICCCTKQHRTEGADHATSDQTPLAQAPTVHSNPVSEAPGMQPDVGVAPGVGIAPTSGEPKA